MEADEAMKRDEVATFDNDKIPVLMGPDNADGWTLEGLLTQLVIELGNKTRKIEPGLSPGREGVARVVRQNNRQIVGLLSQARALQQGCIELLDSVAENQGPTGTPRIGEGSDA
jgi:hypothetical protein